MGIEEGTGYSKMGIGYQVSGIGYSGSLWYLKHATEGLSARRQSLQCIVAERFSAAIVRDDFRSRNPERGLRPTNVGTPTIPARY
jgi:hypothetical protein